MAASPLLARWHAVLARHGAEPAVFLAATGGTLTFDELQTQAEARAARWNEFAADGHRVAIYSSTGFDFVLDTLGTWQAGLIACPLEPSCATSPSPSTVEPAYWHGLPAGIVLAKTTSGSTGAPRRVLFTAEALIADADNIVATMGLRREWPNVAAISLAHSYGFSNLVLPLLLHGIPLWLAASSLPEALRAALQGPGHLSKRPHVTLPGVPALWRSWFAADLLDRHIARAISAGAPLPLELEHAVFTATGVKLHTFLGSSECGGITYDGTDVPRTDASLAGTPLHGVRLSLAPTGTLRVESAAVAAGYWPEDEPASDTLGPGWFCTGDLAEERADGWHLLGRAAEVMNLAGRKVHPAEIETVLREHAWVTECLVFSVPSTNAARGEEAVALVNLAPAANSAADVATHLAELREWLCRRLPAWKCPRHWRPAPALAANARGKTPRATWRQWYLEGGEPPVS